MHAGRHAGRQAGKKRARSGQSRRTDRQTGKQTDSVRCGAVRCGAVRCGAVLRRTLHAMPGSMKRRLWHPSLLHSFGSKGTLTSPSPLSLRSSDETLATLPEAITD